MGKGLCWGLPWHGQNGPEARTTRGSAENKKANRERLARVCGGGFYRILEPVIFNHAETSP